MMMRTFLRRPIGVAMTATHRLRVLGWRLSRRPIAGVRAVVLTPDGAVVLVRQSYTRGWHLPAGGARRGEPPERAIRRELREEIGFVEGAVRLFGEEDGRLGRRPHRLSTFAVRDAVYRPRWSLEIEEVRAFATDALPADVAPASRRAIAAVVGP